MKNIVIFGILLLSAGLLAAQTLSVDYVEGRVEVMSGSKWLPVNNSDNLDMSSSVRLAKGSLLELGYNGSKISLVEEGTYNIKSVASSSKDVKSWNLLNVIGGKLSKTFEKSESATGSATLGVRGAEAGSDGVEWAYDDTDGDPLAKAKALIHEEKYKDAIALLTRYKTSDKPDEKKEASYYLGYAYAMTGDTAIALKEINGSGIASADALYPEYVLLRGKLLLESLSYKKALALFNEYLDRNDKGNDSQSVLILSSFCYKGTGDKAKQKESLRKAINLDPSSAEGSEAKKLLDDLGK